MKQSLSKEICHKILWNFVINTLTYCHEYNVKIHFCCEMYEMVYGFVISVPKTPQITKFISVRIGSEIFYLNSRSTILNSWIPATDSKTASQKTPKCPISSQSAEIMSFLVQILGPPLRILRLRQLIPNQCPKKHLDTWIFWKDWAQIFGQKMEKLKHTLLS